MASIQVTYSVPFGTSVRLGYRQLSSSVPFTYLTNYPTYNQSPYTIDGLVPGAYEIEITEICPNCSGAIFSDPTIYPANSV